jgi:hypothetical protein
MQLLTKYMEYMVGQLNFLFTPCAFLEEEEINQLHELFNGEDNEVHETVKAELLKAGMDMAAPGKAIREMIMPGLFQKLDGYFIEHLSSYV